MVSLVNSNINASSKRQHLREIDLRFAPGLPQVWGGGGANPIVKMKHQKKHWSITNEKNLRGGSGFRALVAGWCLPCHPDGEKGWMGKSAALRPHPRDRGADLP